MCPAMSAPPRTPSPPWRRARTTPWRSSPTVRSRAGDATTRDSAMFRTASAPLRIPQRAWRRDTNARWRFWSTARWSAGDGISGATAMSPKALVGWTIPSGRSLSAGITTSSSLPTDRSCAGVPTTTDSAMRRSTSERQPGLWYEWRRSMPTASPNSPTARWSVGAGTNVASARYPAASVRRSIQPPVSGPRVTSRSAFLPLHSPTRVPPTSMATAVGGSDLGLLFIAWGDCGDCAVDLDGDGVVGGGDLGLMFIAWGETGLTTDSKSQGARSTRSSEARYDDPDPGGRVVHVRGGIEINHRPSPRWYAPAVDPTIVRSRRRGWASPLRRSRPSPSVRAGRSTTPGAMPSGSAVDAAVERGHVEDRRLSGLRLIERRRARRDLVGRRLLDAPEQRSGGGLHTASGSVEQRAVEIHRRSRRG